MSIKTIIVKKLIHRYLKKWIIKKPVALQIGEWEDWHAAAKAENPFLYWTQETAPSAISSWLHVNITWPIRDKYWSLMHKFHPEHQYNIIKPKTLKPGYYDCDYRILHAVMQEVTTFFETGCNYTEWRNSSDSHQHAYNEIEVVYNWWKYQWPHRDTKTIWGGDVPESPELPEEWGFMAAINEKYKDDPRVKEWSRIAYVHMHNENDWDEMENEMLRRVMSVRKFMWH